MEPKKKKRKKKKEKLVAHGFRFCSHTYMCPYLFSFLVFYFKYKTGKDK